MANQLEVIKGRPASFALTLSSDLSTYTMRVSLLTNLNRPVAVYSLANSGLLASDTGVVLNLTGPHTAQLSTEQPAYIVIEATSPGGSEIESNTIALKVKPNYVA